MDGFPPFQDVDKNLSPIDLSNYSALMNIDPFNEQLFSSFISDHLFSQINHSVEQQNLQIRDESSDVVAVSSNAQNHPGGKTTALQPEVLPNSMETDDADAELPNSSYPLVNDSNISEVRDSIPRLIVGGDFLAEKLLKVLSLLKESSGQGILVQVWLPFKQGDKCILSTSEQPYLLDEILIGYREISRTYKFSGKEEPSSVLGLPGRVFISGKPEWTSNILYYRPMEYLRMNHAIGYEVRGSLALPIFSPDNDLCCAVLELVTKKEKPDFDLEIQSVCKALQTVNLWCVKLQAQEKVSMNTNLNSNQKSALAEILGILRIACHAYMLPLAITWIPFSSFGGPKNDLAQERETMLHVHESASYVNDRRMQGFMHACSTNPLHKGQGNAGRATQSNHPVFSSDVKEFDVQQYPVAHHARKFGLHAAVAIRLRSTYTGDDDYILEFFLPINCRKSAEQQLLLNNLSNTLNRTSKSLRRVSDTEILVSDASRMGIKHRIGGSSNREDQSKQTTHVQIEEYDSAFQHQETESDILGNNAYLDQTKSSSFKHQRKTKSKEEKSISLSVLQQYYSGTLRDAAKSIGVCPTTLKKICRQNGISRWPSRKITKVNHSVQKIQRLIDSVPGAIGNIRYDNTTGKLIAEASSSSLWELPSSGETAFGKIATDNSTDNCCQSKNPCNEDNELHVRPLDTIWADAYTSNQKQNPCNKNIVYRNPSCSKITDSSSGSASSDPNPNRMRELCFLPAEEGLMVRVKATYKEDTVCFKFFSSMDISILLEEISKRFKLPIGVFQLKYKDDEDEWVILENDSDLQECIEMLESTGSRRIRLLVRDIPSTIGSSGSSNNLLIES